MDAPHSLFQIIDAEQKQHLIGVVADFPWMFQTHALSSTRCGVLLQLPLDVGKRGTDESCLRVGQGYHPMY